MGYILWLHALNITLQYSQHAQLDLNMFSTSLKIPEAFHFVLIIGIYIPLALAFYFIKKIKMEKEQPVSANEAVQPANDERQSARRRMILLMVIGSAAALSTPLWMPLTGTTLGIKGDCIVDFITAIVICCIIVFKNRNLWRG